jgi:hypothetical protein
MAYTPLSCWLNVRDEHCRTYAVLYRSECDARWFLRGPCVYDEADDANNALRRWESMRFNREACDWLWCATGDASGHLPMRVAPWDDANTTTVDVLATKCRRTPYKYPEFESLW